MSPSGTGVRPSFWGSSLASLLAELETDGSGLSEAEAAARLERFGRNVLKPRRQRALALQFLSRFANPLVLLLLAAAGISAFTGDVASFVIIAVMVLLSVTLDFVQEHRAGRAAERLKRSVALRATVLRDGRPRADHRGPDRARRCRACSTPVRWCRPTDASSKRATSSSTRRC